MKKQFYKFFLASALTIALVMPIFVSAAPSVGVKPTSVFYFFDIAIEKINLFFTFNPENKMRKALEYADERLAEVEKIAAENKPEAVATAMANYQENVSLATAESKEIKDKEKAQSLLSIIADNTSRHQEVLAEVYNKVPDEAKKAIEKAIEVSIKGHDEALKEIQGLKKTVEELQKDIESLKQQGQSDQSKEIEVLRKEVETLKSLQSSQSAKPQVIEKVVEKIVEVPPTTLQKSTAKLSNSEIIEKVKPAVVYIQTSDGSGSGIIIESNGHVLTNAHVVSGFNVAKIKLSDGRLFIGSVMGRDEKIDLALLKIQEDNLPIVVLGDSSTDTLKQGDEVFTLGYPFGLEGDVSFKEGTISRRISDSDTTYLETSAEIHPGNSGGPLVNKYGEVIGINTASYGQSVKGIRIGETIKFALPINLVRSLIPELKTGRNVVIPKITIPTFPSLPTPTPTPSPTPAPAPTPIRTTIFDVEAKVYPPRQCKYCSDNLSYSAASAILFFRTNKTYISGRILYSTNSNLESAKVVEISGGAWSGSDPRSSKISDNLEPGKIYYYQIIIKDTGSFLGGTYDPEEVMSPVMQFETPPAPTPVRTTIFDVRVELFPDLEKFPTVCMKEIEREATIYFKTNKSYVNGKIRYSTNSNLESAKEITVSTGLVWTTVSDLEHGKTYYYQIIIKDTGTSFDVHDVYDPEEAASPIMQFETPKDCKNELLP